MQKTIGVRFQKAGKIIPYMPGQLELELGEKVIVDTARGMECGTVVTGEKEIDETKLEEPLRVVRRIANDQDLKRLAENMDREKEAFRVCVDKIRAHQLEMKLVRVEYTFDRNKIIFYFTADGRIDFRDLVKDLASVFHTRIELRQIGVRDEAKFMGGIGCCGRPLCCASFLGEFQPVSIRMAKDQNLSLNPTKISGICGRLMCCLKYENDGYCNGTCCGTQKRKTFAVAPTQGHRVATIDGDGKVISVNQQRHTATILLDNSRTIVASWDDVVEKDEDDAPQAAAESTASGEKEQREHRERRPRRPRRPRNGERDWHDRQNRGERNEHKNRSEQNGRGEKNERREHRKRDGGEQGSPRRPRRPRRERNSGSHENGSHEGRRPRREHRENRKDGSREKTNKEPKE